MPRDSFEFIARTSDDAGRKNTFDGGTYSLYRHEGGPGDFTDGEDSHDGYPGGLPTASDWHGTGRDDFIDMSDIAFDQTIHGFAGNDNIIGGHGENLIVGGLGNDIMSGNAGFDTIVGGEGNDTLDGGADGDELHAGSGADSIFGGTGNDFIFLTDDDTPDTVVFNKWDGNDVIDGFEVGVDKLHLAGFDFDGFSDLNSHISYNNQGQAHIDLGGGDSIILTGLDGPLGWDDIVL